MSLYKINQGEIENYCTSGNVIIFFVLLQK